MVAATIPVIDLAKWHSAQTDRERLAVAKELIDGCRSIGFVYIINHGMPEDLLDEAFAMSARMFHMSDEDKALAEHPPGTAVHRGWTKPGRMKEAVDDEEALSDAKESFEVGSEQNASQPNLWYPENKLPGFKDLATRFYWANNSIVEDVLQVIAVGVGLQDPKHLQKLHSGHNHQLRLAHYPAVPAASIENGRRDRCSAHTDFSTITLVFQDDCGGLQVKNPYKDEDAFVDATPIKGALVMNIGEPLMRWSNDFLMSNKHRVVMPPLADRVAGEERMTRERYSFVYFVASNPDAVIETFPGCIDADHPGKYEPLTTAQYHQMMFAKFEDQFAEEKK